MSREPWCDARERAFALWCAQENYVEDATEPHGEAFTAGYDAAMRDSLPLSLDEWWAIYGLLCAEVTMREERAFDARHDLTHAIPEADAATWRTLRRKVRLLIEATR